MLFRIRDIFQDKRMDVEVLSNLLYSIQLMKTFYVYPCDGWCILKRKALFDRLDFLLLKLRRIIVDGYDSYLLGFSLTYVNKSPGRKTSFL